MKDLFDLLYHHMEEMYNHEADAWNLGWYQSDTRLESKTDKGILISEVIKGKVIHTWCDYEDYNNAKKLVAIK